MRVSERDRVPRRAYRVPRRAYRVPRRAYNSAWRWPHVGGPKPILAKHSLSLRQQLPFPLRVLVGVHASKALQNPKSKHRFPLGMVFPKGDPSGSPRNLCSDSTNSPVPRAATPGRYLWVVAASGLGDHDGLHPHIMSPIRSLKVRPFLPALRHILFKVEDHLSHLSQNGLSQSSSCGACQHFPTLPRPAA